MFLDFQGFNTGVALYHLGRMRASLEYAAELDVARMRQLSHKKYLMPGTVGDQVRSFQDLGKLASGLADFTWVGKTRALPSSSMQFQCTDS